MSNIILKAKGVRTISREESINLEVPQATVSYCPISNNEIIQTTLEQLDRNGFQVKSEFHKCDGSKKKFVGGFIISGGNQEMDIMFGYKNSYDRSMSAAFALGANIMICSNSVVTGEVSMIRKHTGTANQILTYGISEGIKQLGDNFLSIEKQLEEMKQIEVSKRICAELVGRLYLEEEIITAHQLSAIKGELTFESYDYGVKDTLFNLYQATTHAMKSSHPRTFLTDHIDAHSFFTSQAGIVVPTKTINVEPYSPFKQLDLFEDLFDKEALETEYNSNSY